MQLAVRVLTQEESSPPTGAYRAVQRYTIGVDDTVGSAGAELTIAPVGSAAATANHRQTLSGIDCLCLPRDGAAKLFDTSVCTQVVRPVCEGTAMQGLVVVDGGVVGRLRALFGAPDAGVYDGLVPAALEYIQHRTRTGGGGAYRSVLISVVNFKDNNAVDDMLRASFDAPSEARLVEDPKHYFTAVDNVTYRDAMGPSVSSLSKDLSSLLSSSRPQLISVLLTHAQTIPASRHRRSASTVQFLSLPSSEYTASRNSGSRFRTSIAVAAQLIATVEASQQRKQTSTIPLTLLLKPAFEGTQPAVWVSVFAPIGHNAPTDESFADACSVVQLAAKITCLNPHRVSDSTKNSGGCASPLLRGAGGFNEGVRHPEPEEFLAAIRNDTADRLHRRERHSPESDPAVRAPSPHPKHAVAEVRSSSISDPSMRQQTEQQRATSPPPEREKAQVVDPRTGQHQRQQQQQQRQAALKPSIGTFPARSPDSHGARKPASDAHAQTNQPNPLRTTSSVAPRASHTKNNGAAAQPVSKEAAPKAMMRPTAAAASDVNSARKPVAGRKNSVEGRGRGAAAASHRAPAQTVADTGASGPTAKNASRDAAGLAAAATTGSSITTAEEFQLYKSVMENTLVRLRADLNAKSDLVAELQSTLKKRERTIQKLHHEFSEGGEKLRHATLRCEELESDRAQLQGEFHHNLSLLEQKLRESREKKQQLISENQELQETVAELLSRNASLKDSVMAGQFGRRLVNAMTQTPTHLEHPAMASAAPMRTDGGSAMDGTPHDPRWVTPSQLRLKRERNVSMLDASRSSTLMLSECDDPRNEGPGVPRATQTQLMGCNGPFSEAVDRVNAVRAELMEAQEREAALSNRLLDVSEREEALRQRIDELDVEVSTREDSEMRLKTEVLRLEQKLRLERQSFGLRLEEQQRKAAAALRDAGTQASEASVAVSLERRLLEAQNENDDLREELQGALERVLALQRRSESLEAQLVASHERDEGPDRSSADQHHETESHHTPPPPASRYRDGAAVNLSSHRGTPPPDSPLSVRSDSGSPVAQPQKTRAASVGRPDATGAPSSVVVARPQGNCQQQQQQHPPLPPQSASAQRSVHANANLSVTSSGSRRHVSESPRARSVGAAGGSSANKYKISAEEQQMLEAALAQHAATGSGRRSSSRQR